MLLVKINAGHTVTSFLHLNTLHISHIINFCCCCHFCLFVVVMAEYNTLAEQCYGTYMDTVRR